ncbi:hypothetical protein KGQ72_02130 [Patescibacteria group bacterium]|nr:hypothetical protein [Patescibacteria group bacterium]
MTMKYATLDLGTIEAVFNKLGGLEGAKRFLSGAAEVVLKSILSLVNGKVASDAIKTFDPHSFYTMRGGLWIGNFFRDNVLAKAASIKKLSATTLKSFDLTKNAYDRDIIPCLPQNYEFDISEALARIAQMIERQPDGKEGDLLNNGYANLFYVPGYVVGVDWRADGRGWGVSAWERDDGRWNAGSRVFVRN